MNKSSGTGKIVERHIFSVYITSPAFL